MTREEIYSSCVNALNRRNYLLLEAATGFGKSKIAIDLINHLCANVPKDKEVRVLLLVAKRVHKQTWRDEIYKWGGLNVTEVVTECYESLKKHTDESFDIVIADEVHHLSEARQELLDTLEVGYFIGLSATIPRKLKQYFNYRYKAEIVSCDIVEAIDSDVLPEPKILLFPLELENKINSEVIVLNPKAKGEPIHDVFKNYWKCKRIKNKKVLISCTQKEYINTLNTQILYEKNRVLQTRNPSLEKIWLYHCGKRLEFLAYCKNPIVKDILKHLYKERTITFCKTIEQCEELGSNCIHSKNNRSTAIYDAFNKKEIDHITAVNILNENANLVDCKYAIFANLSSSEVVIPQRLGRAMRHKSPIIIMPYYKGTREEEIVEKMLEGFNKDFIQTINSIKEI